MSAPKRIQQRRTKGWRKPEGAVAVGRPGKWGNPVSWRPLLEDHDPEMARQVAVESFIDGRLMGDWPYPSDDEIRAELAGKDLMCWCPLPGPGQPDHCHAAVLIELANTPEGLPS